MKLTIVGCSGSYPGPDSSSSCYLVEHDGFHLVVDMGSGSLGYLQRHLDPRQIDAIALSHLHPDHCLDMTALHVMAKYHPAGHYGCIEVWAPPEAPRYLRLANGVDGAPIDAEFDFKAWFPGSAVSIGPFRVTPTVAKHPVTAYSLRIEAGGRVLAYSGDTGPHDGILDVARDADVFLCEASFVESAAATNPPDLHLTGREAGHYATEAGVGRLLVTHVPEWTDRAEVERDVKDAYEGEWTMVRTGQVFDV